MTIEIINDKEKWDTFVNNSPYGFLFHKWDFLKIIEKYSNYTLYNYGIFKGDKIICIFPLFQFKKLTIKMLFSPPPKTAIPYLGFLFDEEYKKLKESRKEDYLKLIFNEVKEEINRLHPKYISISLIPDFLDIRQFKWNGYHIEPRFTYTIDLNNPLEQIWSDFKENVRRSIKKGEKIGYTLVIEQNISSFYQNLTNRYKEQNLKSPLLSESYLGDLVNMFSNNIFLYSLKEDGNIINNIIAINYNNNFLCWLGGITKKNDANEYLIWQLIQIAKIKNCNTFDFVGANTEHICMFKSKFNPNLSLYFLIEKETLISKLLKSFYKKFNTMAIFNGRKK